MTDEQINESMAKGPSAYQAMQAHEIDAIVKWVGEIDGSYVLSDGRMRYMMSYWIRTRNAESRDAKIGMAFNHIQECLREIVRLRAELDGIAGRAKAAIAEPPLGKPDHVCRDDDLTDTTAHEFDGGTTRADHGDDL